MVNTTFRYGANFRIVGKCDPQKLSYAGAWENVEGTFKDLAAHIGKGHPWMPALLDGNRKRWQSNANHAEVLAIDVDGGMTIQEFLKHPMAQYCSLGIESANSKPEHHKFRAVFRYSKPVQGWEKIRNCQRYMMALIDVADLACKDSSRFFFGAPGRVPFLLNEDARLPEDFIDQALAWTEEQERVEQAKAEEDRRRWQAELEANPDRDEKGLILDALRYADPDCSYEQWTGIGMTLVALFGSEGVDLWHGWSQGCSRPDHSFRRKECHKRARTFRNPQPRIGQLIKLAKDGGFRFSRKSQKAYRKALKGIPGPSPLSLFKKPGTEIGLTRKPDLHIGDREFSEVADTLPKSGLVVLYGGKGTSKTDAIAIMIKGRSALSNAHLTSIAHEQASRFKGMFLNDANRDNPIGDVVTVCVPSIAKVVGSHEVLIIDETTAVLHFLLESKLANKHGQRPILVSEMEARIRGAKLVILADADLTDGVIEWVEAIQGEKAYLVESSRKPLGYAASFVDGTRHEAIAMLQQRAEQATDKLIVINTDSKKLAESLVEVLGREKCLLITADTSADLAVKTLFASKGGTLPHLLEQGIRFVVASPSVLQGFSIEQHTDLIDSNWGFFTGGSITVEGAAQSLGRVRSADVPRFVWCAHAGSAYSKFSRALTVERWVEDFKSLTSATARIARNGLAGDVTIEGFLERQERNTKLLASLETRRNQGMANLRNGLIGLLEKEGVKVEYIKPDISPVAAKLAGQALKAAEQANDRAEAQRVAARPLISQSEADGLANSSEPLTQEQQDDLTKFYVVTFYKLEDATAEDVLFDRKGRTRKEITFLERILNPSLALERTEQSLNKNECPQDWDSAALQIRYIELSGFGQLIRAIVAGEVETLTADLTAPIVEYVRANADEFRLLFKVSPDRISDRQIIGEILGGSGIKTKRVGNKNNHRYIIRKPELEALLAIVERRQVAVTPPQEDIDYLTGCDPFLSQWKTPECLEDIRQMWQIVKDDPAQRVWLEAETPPEILRLALAA